MINLNNIKYGKQKTKDTQIEEAVFSFYWLFDPQYTEDWQEEEWDYDLLDIKGKTIETVNGGIARRAIMEGTAKLPSGKIVNLVNTPKAKSDPRQSDARFREVDPQQFPWGYDFHSQGLVPWISVATDPHKIPHGKYLTIPLFKGLEVFNPVTEKNIIHNGQFKAQDHSWSFTGLWIDIFTGSFTAYKNILAKLDTLAIKKTVKNAEDIEQEHYYTKVHIL